MGAHEKVYSAVRDAHKRIGRAVRLSIKQMPVAVPADRPGKPPRSCLISLSHGFMFRLAGRALRLRRSFVCGGITLSLSCKTRREGAAAYLNHVAHRPDHMRSGWRPWLNIVLIIGCAVALSGCGKKTGVEVTTASGLKYI